MLFLPDEIKSLKQGKSLLMVSGGPDSVYLFHQYLNLKKQFEIEFSVIHFNHHLRAEESDREQAFVEDLCAENKINCHVHHLKFKNKKGIQLQARKKRYGISLKHQADYGFKFLVTAHHRDDTLETVLMRIGRGAGLKGLCGIRRRFEMKNPSLPIPCVFFRPLLKITKKTISEFLFDHKMSYCIDSSNLSTNYLRNAIRQNLVPKIKVEERLDLVRLSESVQVLDDYWQERLRFQQKRYSHHVPLTSWDSWPNELQFRFFCVQLRRLGYVKQIQAKHFSAIQEINCHLELGSVHILKDRSGCYFYSSRQIQQFMNLHHELKGMGSYYLACLSCKLDILKTDSIDLEHIKDTKDDSSILYIEAAKLKLPLFVTTWKQGDVFRPYGKKKPIKLKDFFQIRGIPEHQRKFWPVLRDAQGEVQAVPGLEIADKLAVVSSESPVSLCMRL
jgi:tRNA(Ile)-lysidine synthase